MFLLVLPPHSSHKDQISCSLKGTLKRYMTPTMDKRKQLLIIIFTCLHVKFKTLKDNLRTIHPLVSYYMYIVNKFLNMKKKIN